MSVLQKLDQKHKALVCGISYLAKVLRVDPVNAANCEGIVPASWAPIPHIVEPPKKYAGLPPPV